MGKNTENNAGKSRVRYEVLVEVVREKVQEFIQGILEEEITEFLGRGKSGGMKGVDTRSGYRDGYGGHG
jgi:transposase-like protein